MTHGILKGQPLFYLWYVGNDLIGHTTGVEGVFQRHPSLETLSETLEESSQDYVKRSGVFNIVVSLNPS